MLADRVRMSGKFKKNLQSDLPILDGLYLHLESGVENSLILGTNDEVIQWSDLSGNDNHATPPQPQYAPTYDGEMIIFNDAHALQFNQIDLQKDSTVFFVAKVASGKPAAHQIISNNLGQNSQLRVEATSGSFRLVGSPGIGGSGSYFGYDTLNQAGARFNLGTQAQTFNYDSYGVIGTPASSTITANQIGARVLTGSEFLIGSVKEVIIYNRALTNSEISQINEHIRNKIILKEV